MSKKRDFVKPIIILTMITFLILLPACNQGALTGKGYSDSGIPEISKIKYAFFNQKAWFQLINEDIIRSLTRCGDGTLQEGEQCDDGNLLDGDSCSSRCSCEGILEAVDLCPDICGDYTIITTEECDDGNLINHDGCSSECIIEELVCGNWIPEVGEECDHGLTGSDLCTPECTRIICGNGIVESGEECDSEDRTLCTARCTSIVCGDSRIEGVEECDGGPFCTPECTSSVRTCYNCEEDGCREYSTIDISCVEFDSLDACLPECGGRVAIPPTPEDEALCATPDPEALPEGTRYREFPPDETRYISTCEAADSPFCIGDSCRHLTICRPDGGITINVIPCPSGFTCDAGLCLGDIWSPECSDSDSGFNPSTFGIVTVREPERLRDFPDTCSGTSVAEQFCIGGLIRDERGFNCQSIDKYCVDGRCVSLPCDAPTSSCDETDSGDAPLEPGVSSVTTTICDVEGSDSDPDECDFEQTTLREFYCFNSISRVDRYYNCNDPGLGLCDTYPCRCEPDPDGARCLPGELPTITCEDNDETEPGDGRFVASTVIRRRSSDGNTLGRVDSCLTATTVREKVCVGAEFGEVRLNCPDGFCCSGGACHAGACVGGEVVNCLREEATGTNAGYLTLTYDESPTETISDFCSSDTQLQILGCSLEGGPPVIMETVDCAVRCENGLCVG